MKAIFKTMLLAATFSAATVSTAQATTFQEQMKLVEQRMKTYEAELKYAEQNLPRKEFLQKALAGQKDLRGLYLGILEKCQPSGLEKMVLEFSISAIDVVIAKIEQELNS